MGTKKRLMTVLLVVGFVFVGLTMLNGCKDDTAADPNSTSSDEHDHDHDHGEGGHTHEHPETAMTPETVIAGSEQTMCPVMESNKINKKYSVEYQGKKVYFCCPGCDKKFTANPDKYLAKLPQFKE